MIKKLLVGLLLAVLLVGGIASPLLATSVADDYVGVEGASYSPGDEIVSERGRSHRVFYEGDGIYRAEFVGSPEFTESNGEWVEYAFYDYGYYYVLQHPWSSVGFFEDYTIVWDEAFTNVVVYDDRWLIEYLNKQENWVDASFWNITLSYEEVSDGIKLIRTGDTDIGQRVDTYYFRNGAPCKIEIKITPTEAQEVRFVWKQSGIVASGELSEIDEETEKTKGMRWVDAAGNNVWIARWTDELNIVDTVNVIAESHAQGRKATITFESISVSAGQAAILDPDTFYPDPHDETTSVDGRTLMEQTSGNFSGIRDGAGTSAFPSDASTVVMQIISEVGDNYKGMSRGIYLFDTSALPDSAVVSAATFSLYPTVKLDTESWNTGINIYASDPDTDIDLIPTDFALVSEVAFATSIAHSSIILNQYNVWTFNAAGRAAISTTSITKLSVRSSTYDVANVPPGVPGHTHIIAYYAEQGTVYRPRLIVTYTSLPDPPTSVAATDGDHTDKVVITWTKSDGATKYEVFRDAGGLGELGDVATYDDTAASAGIITPGTATASDGTSPDHVTLSLAGESVADGTTHTYTVKAGNAAGWSGASGSNTGYRTTGTITYQWQRSAADSDASYSLLSGATTDPHNDTTAPSNGDGRWYYCEVSATGATTQDSTHNRGYRIGAPTVTTQVATNIEDTTATGNGNIVDTADGNCSAWGIVWNTTGNPDTGDNVVGGSGAGGTGAFTASLTSLPTGTTIHTKAYATNAAGTGYGAEEDFLTKPAAPTDVAATDGTETSKVVVTWTKSTGATGYKVYEGTNLLDTLGDVATFDDLTAPAGTITNAGTVTASDGTSTAHVTLSLAGESTVNGAPRTYKVVALNATGDSDDSTTNDGYRGVGSITYQWQVNDGGGYDNIAGGTTDPYNYEDAPAGIITPGVATSSDGGSTAHVTLSLAGESVADGASYTYQCIVSSVDASNSPQTSDNNTGYRTTGALTYQWQRSSGDSDASYSNIGGGTTDPYNDTAAPAGTITAGSTVASDGTSTAYVSLSLDGTSVNDGAGRYFRCVLSATGTTNQNSTADRGYRTTGALTYQWKRSDADSDANYNTNLGTNSTYDDTGAPAPTITAGSTIATDGTETAHIALSLSGTSANVGDGRYYICVLNATGTTEQTSATNRGYRGVGALTYQWQKSSGTGDEDYSNIDGATNSTYNDTAAPAGSITNAGIVTASVDEYLQVALSLTGETTTDGAIRYFKCVLTATGATGQTSASNDGYRGVGAITFAWQRSAADSDASYSPIGGGTTDPYNDTTAPAGTITPGIATASDGIAEAYVTLIVSGHTTASGAGRYFKCIISSVDASNTPQTSNNARGYRVVGALTYTWERSDADSDGSYNTEIGTTNPYNDTGAPSNGDGRYFRCKLDATGAAQAITTTNRGYRAVSGWEQLITGDNADGDDIYGVNWAAQQFTAGSVSHTVTAARVKIKRVGAPGTVILSLRLADETYVPIEADLLYGTLDGDTLSTAATWYEFAFTTEISMEAGELYALVMRASSGDAANYIEWRWDSDGGLDNAIASLSTDAGVTWTVDAGEADYLFEIRGTSLIEMIGAQVFGDYVETGDWLIALTYENEYVSYYPNENPAVYFSLQLLDGIVVKSQTSCVAWGYRPGSIYLSKAFADTLEWGATDYTIRLYGDFGTNPAAEYLLATIDWRGTDLDLLDDWVIAQAKDIGNDIGINLVIPIADKGEVLNSYGHAMFSIGIPYLNEVRPELFEMVSQKPPYTEEDYTGGLQGEAGSDWETRLGPQISGFLTDAGDLINVSGDFFGGVLIFLGFLGAVIGLGFAGHLVVGLSLSYPILLVGGWFDLVSWVIIGIITFFMAVIFVYKVWLTR